MAYEMREGSGSLFANDQKGNPKAPAYKGEVLINGVVCELAGWVKSGARGDFISIMCKTKEAKQGQPNKTSLPVLQQAPKSPAKDYGGGGFADMEEDLPF